MQVSKWGNSLAVRLPAKLVAELGLKEGDEVEVRAAGGALEVAKTAKSVEDWFAELDRIGPLLPADFKFDRDELYPVSRGGTAEDE